MINGNGPNVLSDACRPDAQIADCQNPDGRWLAVNARRTENALGA
jgi:hypothetical protein